jgi:hypothetical protein
MNTDTTPERESGNGDPDTLRDIGPIRPLSKGVSRIVITAAMLAAILLSVYAARLMGSLSEDEDIQTRFETIEAMRRQGRSPDRLSLDSLEAAVPAALPDSLTPPDSM